MCKLKVKCFMIVGLMVGAISSGQGLAQRVIGSYPNKPIRLIVPFPPGGTNDLFARAVASSLAEQAGQAVVIDNRGGAGAIIGTEIAAKSVPDGYTLLIGGTASLSINPVLHKKLPYDPLKDFASVSLLGIAPNVLAVHPSLPAKSVKDLIQLARQQPGKLGFSTAGIGTSAHLSGELFKSMAGVNMLPVHYRGGATGYADLLSGEVLTCFCGIGPAMPHVKQGKLRGIAVTSAQRTALVPNLPTVAESGLAGFEVSVWYSIVAPAGTPNHVVTYLNQRLLKVLTLPDLKNRLLALGVEPESSTPEKLAAYNRSEIEKWAKVIKFANIKPE